MRTRPVGTLGTLVIPAVTFLTSPGVFPGPLIGGLTCPHGVVVGRFIQPNHDPPLVVQEATCHRIPFDHRGRGGLGGGGYSLCGSGIRGISVTARGQGKRNHEQHDQGLDTIHECNLQQLRDDLKNSSYTVWTGPVRRLGNRVAPAAIDSRMVRVGPFWGAETWTLEIEVATFRGGCGRLASTGGCGCWERVWSPRHLPFGRWSGSGSDPSTRQDRGYGRDR